MDHFSRHIDRRRAVFAILLHARPVSLTVDEVTGALARQGMVAPHRKAMADLLGGLVRSGRAVRTERGRYRAAEGWSRSTVRRALHWRELMDRWRSEQEALYGPFMSPSPTVRTERDGPVTIVTIDRPEVRNAVDGPTARQLYSAFQAFDDDDAACVAVLVGAQGTFCAGADLKAVATNRGNPVFDEADERFAASLGPMGPTRLLLGKPVIAAVEGFAVAGGLELAAWCDLRVAARDAVFGVFCRRWGVPLIDGGTVRLPRLVGHSHAMDLILTGREVGAEEAQRMGLVNRVSEPGAALADAVALAHDLARFPQRCLRGDRLSAYGQWDQPYVSAMRAEVAHGLATIRSNETREGAARFAAGHGRHGRFDDLG
jgi:enoyl-CoA hydratase